MQKKKMIMILVLLAITIYSFAQTPDWLWANEAGSSDGYEDGTGITTDSDGNVYSTGRFLETATFGPFVLSVPERGIFISKTDIYGNWIWAEEAYCNDSFYSYAICTDEDGNIYVTGMFQDDANFGSFALHASSSRYDMFVAKMDSEGNWLWAIDVGSNESMGGYAIDTDTDSNVYLTGFCGTSTTFGSTQLTGNSFVAKADTDGNWLWAVNAGNLYGKGLVTGEAGSVYVTGRFNGTANFGSTALTSNGDIDMFVAKADTAGNWQWAQNGGGNSPDEGFGIDIDAYSNIYATGYFNGSASFGSFNLTTYGYQDIFVVKLDNAGNWLWAENAGSSSEDQGRSIALDNNGNAHLTGVVRHIAYFGSHSVDCGSGYTDIFVAKIDTNGNWIWANIADGDNADYGNGICTDENNNIFLTGTYFETVNFGSHTLNAGWSDRNIFIARFGFNLDANFEADSTFGYLPFTVNFSDLSLGNIVSWQWDFQNDGVFDSIEQNPTFVYEDEGNYDVKLVISDGTYPDSLIKHNYITVEYVPPAAPTDVQVDIVYPDAVISWTAVDTTIYGTPMTPDLYIIQYSEVAEDSAFYYLSSVLHPITEFTHIRVLQYGNNGYPSEHMFYKVISVKDMNRNQIAYLKGLNNSREKVRWSEVKQNLKGKM
ncbi:MAG: PKD domain-containing protein [Bacteroidales bacterium]|nr:PKD domain-containing protein [Bacteroidales bacterium]